MSGLNKDCRYMLGPIIYIGIMENKMETIIQGIEVWSWRLAWFGVYRDS